MIAAAPYRRHEDIKILNGYLNNYGLCLISTVKHVSKWQLKYFPFLAMQKATNFKIFLAGGGD